MTQTDYEFNTIGLADVCPVCKSLNGQKFKIKDRKPGLNFPPMHTRCRCAFLMVMPDLETMLDDAEKAKKTSDKSLKKSYNSGIINKKQVSFNTKDDPMRDIYGSAFNSNPIETEKIIENFKKLGVDVIYKNNVMSYQPNPTSGKPGQIVIDKEASYSAWKHEECHVLDDKASGWAGFRNYMDINKAIEFEENAYNIEIELAKSNGLDDIANKLKALKEKSRRDLLGE